MILRKLVLDWMSNPQNPRSTSGHTPILKLSGSLPVKCGHETEFWPMGCERVMCLTASRAEKVRILSLPSFPVFWWRGETFVDWCGWGEVGATLLPLSTQLGYEFWTMECEKKSRAQIPGLVCQILPRSLLTEWIKTRRSWRRVEPGWKQPGVQDGNSLDPRSIMRRATHLPWLWGKVGTEIPGCIYLLWEPALFVLSNTCFTDKVKCPVTMSRCEFPWFTLYLCPVVYTQGLRTVLKTLSWQTGNSTFVDSKWEILM